MSDKSYVSTEKHICPICGTEFKTGSLLLDKRLRDSFESATLTGMSLCKEHRTLRDDGYIALIEVRNQETSKTINFEDADRTGRIMHIKIEALKKITDITEIKDLMFINEGFFNALMGIYDS